MLNENLFLNLSQYSLLFYRKTTEIVRIYKKYNRTAHPARFVFINKKVLWPWVEVIVTAGSAQCHFANATLVSRFHFVALGCSSPTLYALDTLIFFFCPLYELKHADLEGQHGLVEPRSTYAFVFVAKNHRLVVVRGQVCNIPTHTSIQCVLIQEQKHYKQIH